MMAKAAMAAVDWILDAELSAQPTGTCWNRRISTDDEGAWPLKGSLPDIDDLSMFSNQICYIEKISNEDGAYLQAGRAAGPVSNACSRLWLPIPCLGIISETDGG